MTKKKTNIWRMIEIIITILLLMLLIFVIWKVLLNPESKNIIIINNTDDDSDGGSSGGGGDESDDDDSNDDSGGGGDDSDAEDESCFDSDGGNKPLAYGYVNDELTQASYVDNCIQETFPRYLNEQYCENGVRKETTIDCWNTYGAVCYQGRCMVPPCEQIPHPDSQSDCDRGHPCLNSGEETYCKYIAATSTVPSKCVCTIEPSSINSCDRQCWFDGYSDGYCYEGPISRDPCGNNDYSFDGSQYCPLSELIRTCCCI